MEISLLGGFRIAGIPDAAWQRPSARRLIKLLALTPEHRLHGEQIIETLWPELDPAGGANALRKAVYLARRALEPDATRASGRYLIFTSGVASLSGDVEVDVDRFVRLARQALSSGRRKEVQAALVAYEGELLPEDRYEEWAEGRRRELEGVYVQLLRLAAEEEMRQGAAEAAVGFLQRLLQIDPLAEDTHRLLMRALDAAGQRHRALQQFEHLRDRLGRELGIEPEAGTLAIYRALSQESDLPPVPPVLQRPPAAPFVGREHALQRLQAVWIEARQSRGGLVLISGEPGVGKTRLAVELARQVSAQEGQVLWGASHAQEGAVPYAPFVAALQTYLRTLSAADRTKLAARYPSLIQLLPALLVAGALPATPARELEQTSLFSALAGILEELAARRPLLLVLDDLHTADATTLQLLHYLTTRAAAEPWLILGTYRREEVGADTPAGLLLHRLIRFERGREINLLRLPSKTTADLLAALLPGAPVDPVLDQRLWELSLGNPLAIQELVYALRERGALVQDDAWRLVSTEPVPVSATFDDLVEERVTRLGAHAREVLAVAAVAGTETDFALLHQVLSLAPADLLDALDRILMAQLLVEEGDGYRLTHPLVRSALYERLSQTRRRYLHARIGAALEGKVRPAVLLHHFRQAGVLEKTMEYAEFAADEARLVYSREQAETLYREAEELAEALGQPLRAAAVRLRLGDLLRLEARYAEALTALDDALAVFLHYADLSHVAEATAGIGRTHHDRGTISEGVAVIQEFLPSLAPAQFQTEQAELYAALAQLLYASQRHEESLAAADRAFELARAAGADYLLADIQISRGTELTLLGRHQEAESIYRDGIGRAEATHDLAALQRGQNDLGFLYYRTGRLEAAAAQFDQAVEAARRLGDPSRLVFDLANLGGVLHRLGRDREARVALERAETLACEVPGSWYAAYPALQFARLLLDVGELRQAGVLAGEALHRAAPSEGHHIVAPGQALLAEAELLVGQAEQAYRRLTELEVPAASRSAILPTLGWTALATGRGEEALHLTEEALTLLEAEDNVVALTEALSLRALALAEVGRLREARALLRASLRQCRSLPYPLQEAWTLYRWGRVEMVSGRHAIAHTLFRYARHRAHRLGAGTLTQLIEGSRGAAQPREQRPA